MTLSAIALIVSILSIVVNIIVYRINVKHAERRWSEYQADQKVIAAIRSGATFKDCLTIYQELEIDDAEDRAAYYVTHYGQTI